MLDRKTLMALYDRLFNAYGPQHWWPAESPFEVMVGAVLTQNTAWSNVEKAIAALRQADKLEPRAVYHLAHEELGALIRSAGYFNVKSRRLKNLCQWLIEQGGIEKLQSSTTAALRKSLLSINGIGPETADDILLYAFNRPVFVIDTYTRRLLASFRLIKGDEDYEELRAAIEAELAPECSLFNEYHALIVRHAKEKCTVPGNCLHCRVQAPID